jgi:uncharacterized protein (TIGR02246 family)
MDRYMFLLLAGLALSPAFAQSDEAEIRDLVARYVSAREAQDPARAAALFTDDADQLVSSGEWRRGREALVKGAMASSRANEGRRSVVVESVRFIAAGVAIADGRYEISGAETRRMWSTFVVIKTGEGWRIAAIRNMLPARR